MALDRYVVRSRVRKIPDSVPCLRKAVRYSLSLFESGNLNRLNFFAFLFSLIDSNLKDCLTKLFVCHRKPSVSACERKRFSVADLLYG